MAGLIFWIVIIAIMIHSASKKKGKGGQPVTTTRTVQRSTTKTVQSQMDKGSVKANTQQYDQWEFFNREATTKQKDLKERLTNKYKPEEKSSILQRAKASVAEDFSNNAVIDVSVGANTEMQNPTEQKLSGQQRSDNQRQDEIKRRAAEKVAAMEDLHSDVMDRVRELMVVGVDTSMSFQRDFIAEGMDMLNRVQGQ